MHFLKMLYKVTRGFLLCFIVLALVFIGIVIFYLENALPDVAVLNNWQLQVPLRVFTRDGQLITEYGEKKRIPVPFDQVPPALIQAVLATEDQRFFEHPGVDIWGLLRATLQLAITGSKAQGASTITMQVARNFFLSRQKTFSRKLKEILLAIKIDSALSKEKILDLYLNRIYLGNRAYGVGAAAQVYFGKPLRELNLPQLALIAGLPKAPSVLNPFHNPVASKKRRNHVLARMHEQGYIDLATYQEAIIAPLGTISHHPTLSIKAPYAAEMVRAAIVAQYGEDSAYTTGMNVYTTLSAKAIIAANDAVREELINYDRRHGYRGPITHFGDPSMAQLSSWLSKLRKIPSINSLVPAVVVRTHEKSMTTILGNGDIAFIDWENMSWARPALGNNRLGPVPQKPADILKPGDVIYIEKNNHGTWRLSQKPHAEASLISMNPQTGAIEALVGGFDYQDSNFNRVTQAKLQAGSTFKPFIYSAALSKGFSLATMMNDAPFVTNNTNENDLWRPQNYNRRFYGMTRLREALVKSRNLVSIRVLDAAGIQYTINYLARFGFVQNQLPANLSLALGTAQVSPLELASGFAVIANGGYQVKPYLIAKITNAKGETLYKASPKRACEACIAVSASQETIGQVLPDAEIYAPRTIDPQTAFLITSALKDVVRYGTAKDVKNFGLTRADLAGKTGTTNEQKDAWFAGFNSDLVAVVWLGFDAPQSLHEYANKAALPMWAKYMNAALQGKPEHSMPQPPGIVALYIDPQTGRPVPETQSNAIVELFTTASAEQLKQIENMPESFSTSKGSEMDNETAVRTTQDPIEDIDNHDTQLF